MSTDLFSLEGRVALVTGASRGIGRAIALGLAAAGADVALASRSEGDLESVAKEIADLGRRSLVVPTDVGDRGQIERMVRRCTEELGGLDVLVNNAGGFNFLSPLVDVRPEGWDKILNLNLSSVFHATQLAARHMLASGRGSIVNIASAAGRQGVPLLSSYSAAKAGVTLLTQAAAKELAESNVRVNAVAPGFVATQLTEAATSDPATLEMLEARIPMRRLGRAEEIVGAAIFLASDAASYVTGTTLVVDGGATA
ncbi:MAG TPA: SDR family NAD(P)-dependent oxidoreductase [Actinomycetota bacterium]|nr:SDR family NAD(P)-dependent oxidoreductase [Actinomycetota bacterium]